MRGIIAIMTLVVLVGCGGSDKTATPQSNREAINATRVAQGEFETSTADAIGRIQISFDGHGKRIGDVEGEITTLKAQVATNKAELHHVKNELWDMAPAAHGEGVAVDLATLPRRQLAVEVINNDGTIGWRNVDPREPRVKVPTSIQQLEAAYKLIADTKQATKEGDEKIQLPPDAATIKAREEEETRWALIDKRTRHQGRTLHRLDRRLKGLEKGLEEEGREQSKFRTDVRKRLDMLLSSLTVANTSLAALPETMSNTMNAIGDVVRYEHSETRQQAARNMADTTNRSNREMEGFINLQIGRLVDRLDELAVEIDIISEMPPPQVIREERVEVHRVYVTERCYLNWCSPYIPAGSAAPVVHCWSECY